RLLPRHFSEQALDLFLSGRLRTGNEFFIRNHLRGHRRVHALSQVSQGFSNPHRKRSNLAFVSCLSLPPRHEGAKNFVIGSTDEHRCTQSVLFHLCHLCSSVASSRTETRLAAY